MVDNTSRAEAAPRGFKLHKTLLIVFKHYIKPTLYIPNPADMPHVGPRSLYFDVTGEARTDRVKLPSCIRGGKPGALPNTQVCYCEKIRLENDVLFSEWHRQIRKKKIRVVLSGVEPKTLLLVLMLYH